jgi:hypothetical protein
MRHLRSPLIALAVLAISAGVVLAGQALPELASDGLDRASQASGSDVPVGAGPSTTDGDAPAAGLEQPDASPDGDLAPEAETGPAADGAAHGAAVSEAATGETPDGWANHGAYVSAVARGLVQPGDPAPDGSDGRIRNGPGNGSDPTSDAAAAKSNGVGRGHDKQH